MKRTHENAKIHRSANYPRVPINMESVRGAD